LRNNGGAAGVVRVYSQKVQL